ncbi:ankyrin repeat-containing domain protein [Dactylonectria estremocensis]|uniref:Ankyrin repeat-containing domain protein n=1 Tax=Dactylonectria estremocensis TaxID=1079267 RepID=A0A9P9FDX3_9HYPO|nr:ankyrin repeat-containing domain protein [Dactylonectria estremocensis]
MLFGEALNSLSLFHDRSYRTKVYRMMIRLCAILGAANGAGEVVYSVRSHASNSERMDAQALKQLEEELLYVSVCEGNAEYVQELLDCGVSHTARINLPSNLRLLNEAYTHDVTLEILNKYWAGYLKPEVFLDEVDKRSKDWEYLEKEPKIIATAGMRDPALARLLLERNNGVALDNEGVFVEAVKSWLVIPDAQEQTEVLETMRRLLYDHMQRSGNKEMLNLALVICAGNPTGTQAVRQLLARDADPNCSVIDEAYRDASKPLVAACRCVSLENVKMLLDAGADPNLEAQSGIIPSVAAFTPVGSQIIWTRDEYGTPLIAASATGQTDFVDLLLEHGATINAAGHSETGGSYPTLAAIFAQHWDLASRFLEQYDASCTKISEEQRKWSMALMFALESDGYHSPYPAVALKLIECGVNVNFAMDDEVSLSILSEAKDSSGQDMDQIRSILSDGGTPLYAACSGGDPNSIKKLQELKVCEEATPAASNRDCLTAACGSEEVEAVEMFLQRGDDVNKCSPGRERWCLLISAAQTGACEIVTLLLGRGARANESYSFKNPAAEPYSLEALTLTLGKFLHFSLLWKRMWDDCTITGPSLLQAKPFFGTPLIAATYSRDEEVMELIAKQEGVDVNQEVRCGIYPTAMMATLDMKKMYRSAGPLRELGATEITASQMLNFSHPFRALFSHELKENVGTTVPGSFWGNMMTLCVNAEMSIPYLLQQGADPNEVVPGSFYGSAFIASSALLRAGTISLFLEHGCDVNAVVPDSPFGTPFIAVCAGPAHYPFQWSFHKEFNLNDPPNWSMVQYDLLEMLLDRDAHPNITHNEFSPLIALMLFDCEEKYKMKGIQLLLDYKADPGITLPQWGYDKV